MPEGVKNPEHSRFMMSNKYCLGRRLSPETKLRISNALKGRIPWNKGKICPSISRARKGKRSPLRGRKRPDISKALRNHKHSEIHNLHVSQALKGKPSHRKGKKLDEIVKNPELTRMRMSEQNRKRWRDPSYFIKVFKNFRINMSGPEKQFNLLNKKHGWRFKYTGNGTLWINRCNPDFAIRKAKICIEVGKPRDRGSDYAPKRIRRYKRVGWKCICFITNRLSEKEVVAKIERYYGVGRVNQ